MSPSMPLAPPRRLRLLLRCMFISTLVHVAIAVDSSVYNRYIKASRALRSGKPEELATAQELFSHNIAALEAEDAKAQVRL